MTVNDLTILIFFNCSVDLVHNFAFADTCIVSDIKMSNKTIYIYVIVTLFLVSVSRFY